MTETIQRKTIMIVEDEEFLVKAYRVGLEKFGFEIITASNGIEALEKIKETKPDLILLDIMMPHMNGYEVARVLKQTPEFMHIPIVILSNLGQPADLEMGRKLGVRDFIIKSDHPLKDILAKVKGYLD